MSFRNPHTIFQGLIVIGLFFSLLACTSTKHVSTSNRNTATKKIDTKIADVKRNLPLRTTDSLAYLIQENDILRDHFVGFVLQDPAQNEELLSINGDRPFTPASNMKLYTLYTALKLLPERNEALNYATKGDSMIIRGTGDPSFLDPYMVPLDAVSDFIQTTDRKLFFDFSNFQDDLYGTGWAWDDFPYYYQAHKSAFPIYGNKFYIRKPESDSITLSPSLFNNYKQIVSDSIHPLFTREESNNNFKLNVLKANNKKVNLDIPFHYSNELLLQLIEDTLQKPIFQLEGQSHNLDFKTIKGHPLDSLLKPLMIVSDNFIAEQLLLMCSHNILGYMNTSELISLAKDSLFADIKNKIKWVDGSGLSRYNLVTPKTNIWVLNRVLETWSFDKIKLYFPSGNEEDTMHEFYRHHEPWIFAKTGSLSNNFNLSGYIITKSNRILTFSFMNNHYLTTKLNLHKEMHKVLSFVRDHY